MNDSILISQNQYKLLISQYMANLDRSHCTKETYKKALYSFFKFIASNQLQNDINPILQYKNYLISRKLSAYTIATYISSLRLFLDYLVKNKIIPDNPARDIKLGKIPKSKRSSLTREEVLKLLTISDVDHSIESLRNKSILYLKLFAGLRDISIIKADIEDIKVLENRYILYYQNKGSQSKEDFVILNNMVYSAINNYMVKRQNPNGKEPLLVSHSDRNKGKRLTTQTIRHAIKTLFKKANIVRADITPHSLRHTAITFAISGGATLIQTQQMANHADIKTTISYFRDKTRLSDPAELYIKDYLFQEERLSS